MTRKAQIRDTSKILVEIACLLVFLFIPFHANAQNHQHDASRLHSETCYSFHEVTTLVAVSSLLLGPPNIRQRVDLPLLAKLHAKLDRTTAYKLLRASGHNESIADFSFYLLDLNKYLKAQTFGETAKIEALLASQSFRERAVRMINIMTDICEASATDPSTGKDYSGLLRVAGNSSSGTTASKQPNVSEFDFPNLNKAYEETEDLLNVFAVLLGIICTLVILNFVYRFLIAVRLDRYDCKIETTAVVEGVAIDGTIDIFSRYGLSFIPLTSRASVQETALQVGQKAVFQIGDEKIVTLQTVSFPGGAGFRILNALEKAKFTKLLTQSQTQPRRRIEHRRKRKPAAPQKAPLVPVK